MSKPSHITLVKNDSEITNSPNRRSSTSGVRKQRRIDEVRLALNELLATLGSLIPADVAILQTLWPSESQPPEARELASDIQTLLSEQEFRQVIIGTEPHLAKAAVPVATEKPHVSRGEAGVDSRPGVDEDAEFDLRVAVDVETERLLLFRVLVVLETVGALLLAREAILWWVGL